MIVIPTFFNALQFWITDNIIKKEVVKSFNEHEGGDCCEKRRCMNESKILIVESK
jgi:hypothetical protein